MSHFDNLTTLIKQAKQDNWQGATLSFGNGVLSNRFMSVSVTLGSSLDEMPNRIIQNDPLSVSFFIEYKGEGIFVAEPKMLIGRLKPESEFYAQSSEKVRTRRVTGSQEKVAKSIGNMLGKLRARIEQLDKENKFLDGLPYTILGKVYK